MHADARFSQAVEQAVTRWEKETDAEIIVVAAPRSGSYRDVTRLGASIGAVVTFGLLELVPFHINPWLLLVDLVLTWLALAWLLDGDRFLRLLVPRARQKQQVSEAAHAEFHRESVHATPARTGVLIYVSALEGAVEVMPDLGLQGRIPGPVMAAACEAFHHDDLDHFLKGLDALGALLAEHVPALEVDLVDLPNAPRVRA